MEAVLRIGSTCNVRLKTGEINCYLATSALHLGTVHDSLGCSSDRSASCPQLGTRRPSSVTNRKGRPRVSKCIPEATRSPNRAASRLHMVTIRPSRVSSDRAASYLLLDTKLAPMVAYSNGRRCCTCVPYSSRGSIAQPGGLASEPGHLTWLCVRRTGRPRLCTRVSDAPLESFAGAGGLAYAIWYETRPYSRSPHRMPRICTWVSYAPPGSVAGPGGLAVAPG